MSAVWHNSGTCRFIPTSPCGRPLPPSRQMPCGRPHRAFSWPADDAEHRSADGWRPSQKSAVTGVYEIGLLVLFLWERLQGSGMIG
ncbi:hypothetical protein GCM10027060_26330 [Nesterenkonia halophila]